LRRKYEENNFFGILKVTEDFKESDPELDPEPEPDPLLGGPDPDPHQSVTDPQHFFWLI
jgi:hypothetical protein